MVRFIVGCDSDEFKRYYRTLDGLHNYFKLLGIQDVRFGELGPTEEAIIKRDPSHLIIWRQGREIIGHAIWHEESINGFTEAGDEEVRESLERLLGEETGFTELHEVWLKEAYRRKGYGKKFFVFFEDLMRKRGRYSIIYFTGDPAAIAICRERGYQEALLPKNKWYVFYVLLKQVHKPKKQIIHCS